MKLTNLKIEQLNEQLLTSQRHASCIKLELQKEYSSLFANDKTLEQDFANAQSASEYIAKEDGIYSWYRMKSDLSMFSKYPELKEYFENYIQDSGLIINWDNKCLENYLGDDNIVIQDDTRRDNGVWQGHKLLYDESTYKTEDGEVDVDKRNALIEEYMNKTGYFPGVFRVTQYGDVFLVNTQAKHNDIQAKAGGDL